MIKNEMSSYSALLSGKVNLQILISANIFSLIPQPPKFKVANISRFTGLNFAILQSKIDIYLFLSNYHQLFTSIHLCTVMLSFINMLFVK